MKQILEAKSMKSLPEKILKVDDMQMYIAYRRDDNCGPDPGIVFFVFTPLSYNKSELRKLMKELGENFKIGLADADIDDEKLGTCNEKELNKRSQIKNKITDAIEKFGEGVAMADKVLAQLDKNKALMSANIADMTARCEQLEDTLEMTDELVDSCESFAEKAAAIKRAMMMKNLKMMICLAIVSVGVIALLLHQMGIF
jgi:hypothetical protein